MLLFIIVIAFKMILFYDYVELNGCLEPFFLLLNGFHQVLLIYCWQANHSFGASNSIRPESQFNHFNGYIFRLELIANLLLMRWLRALLIGMIYEEL